MVPWYNYLFGTKISIDDITEAKLLQHIASTIKEANEFLHKNRLRDAIKTAEYAMGLPNPGHILAHNYIINNPAHIQKNNEIVKDIKSLISALYKFERELQQNPNAQHDNDMENIDSSIRSILLKIEGVLKTL